jgi:hypothetical protein
MNWLQYKRVVSVLTKQKMRSSVDVDTCELKLRRCVSFWNWRVISLVSFCRECIRQYLETATEQEPECPVCHLPITIDLSQDALQDESSSKARQGVLDRLDPGKWRTSTKIEALVEELSKLNHSDHSYVFILVPSSTHLTALPHVNQCVIQPNLPSPQDQINSFFSIHSVFRSDWKTATTGRI